MEVLSQAREVNLDARGTNNAALCHKEGSAGPACAARGRHSRAEGLLDDRLVDKLLEELPVVRSLRARRLGHEDADQLLLRINPEIGAAEAGPHILAGRPGRSGHAVPLPDCEAEPEGVAKRPEQQLARCRRGA